MRPSTNYRETPVAPQVAVPAWLADNYVNSYVRWREEAATVRHAYQLWKRAELGDRAWTFALYDAALDYEEDAARALKESVKLIHLWCR